LHELKFRRPGLPPWCWRFAAAFGLARFNVMIDDPQSASLGGELLRRHAGAGRRAIAALLPL